MTSRLAAATAEKSPLTSNLICMASMLVWSMAFPAVDFLLPYFSPLPLTAARMTLAVAFLIPVWLAVDGFSALGRANWPRALIVGGLGFGIGPLLLVAAQARTDAVTVAVISTTMPVVGIAMECLFDGRRVTWFLIAALVLSFAGGLLACLGAPGGLSAIDLGPGAALAFLSCVFFMAGSRATVGGFPGLSSLGRATVTLTGAAVALSVAATASAFVTGASGVAWAALGWPEFGALVVYGVGAMAISQVLWIIGVERLGVAVASMHINAAPFYVMMFLFLLGAPFGIWQAAGAVVVAIAVLTALRGENRVRPGAPVPTVHAR